MRTAAVTGMHACRFSTRHADTIVRKEPSTGTKHLPQNWVSPMSISHCQSSALSYTAQSTSLKGPPSHETEL